MIHCPTGITSEVFTLTSHLSVEDVIRKIIEIKCDAVCGWVNSLETDIESTAIVGAYLTGTGLSKRFKKVSNVTVVDIYPHLKDLIDQDVEFQSKIESIKDQDLVIDTTGLGGLTSKMSRLVNGKIFLVEDPVSDASDKMIWKKRNISSRLEAANSSYKGVLRTQGLKCKTSGTMTLTLEVLRRSLADVLRKPGVLYGVAGMEFYESVLFKEKNVDKFLNLIKKPALTVSTLKPFPCDPIIDRYLKKIDSQVKKC